MNENIVKVYCETNRSEYISVSVNLDEWDYFMIVYKGNRKWGIRALKENRNNGRTEKEMTCRCVAFGTDLVKFIALADMYGKMNGCVRQIYMFINECEKDTSFLGELGQLLKGVKYYKRKIKKIERLWNTHCN